MASVYKELTKRMHQQFARNLFFVFSSDILSSFSGRCFQTTTLQTSPVKSRQIIAGKNHFWLVDILLKKFNTSSKKKINENDENINSLMKNKKNKKQKKKNK